MVRGFVNGFNEDMKKKYPLIAERFGGEKEDFEEDTCAEDKDGEEKEEETGAKDDKDSDDKRKNKAKTGAAAAVAAGTVETTGTGKAEEGKKVAKEENINLL